jgi:hypothetical protein
MVKRIKRGQQFDPVSVRQYMIENFSIDKMVQGYADLYMEIAGLSVASQVQDLDNLDESRAIA